MGMTMTQKILAAKSGRKENIRTGETVLCNVDLMLGNDITAPIAINEFKKISRTLAAPEKIVLVLDHFNPCKDIKAAEQCKIVRDFAHEYGIERFFDAGTMGIEHALIPEKGYLNCGDLAIGADSHTCTYGAMNLFSTGVGSTDLAFAFATGKCWFKVPGAIRFNVSGKLQKWVSGKDVILTIIGLIKVSGAQYMSMEFTGDLSGLTMADRLTIANMGIEAGAKNVIFECDEETVTYLMGRGAIECPAVRPDEDAYYEREYELNLSDIKPTVAFPSIPDNVRTPEGFGNVKVDQVVIGSCTNGRIEDLRVAASIFTRRKVADGVRVIVIPATQEIYLQAIEEGLIANFISAGCAVSTPTCGPCLGGYMGVLAEGEVCIATTNRNFVGRMGHPKSEVYLASPAVAAASAIKGVLCSPDAL
ncbi:MAG: 3-isopropylmalate dehydratase large subunit [Christensenellaceae bacterium]|nr:3-isopropylmalate dehydratase large subunit [Christensenellaceae bacterium]